MECGFGTWCLTGLCDCQASRPLLAAFPDTVFHVHTCRSVDTTPNHVSCFLCMCLQLAGGSQPGKETIEVMMGRHLEVPMSSGKLGGSNCQILDGLW